MTSSAKQRIIGAFVLCALALIFFPVLFDISSDQAIDRGEKIPPMPEIEPIEIAAPIQVAEVVPPKAEDKIFQPSTAPEELVSREVVPPALNEQGLPKGWLIQLGSFSKIATAQQLNTRLKADGFKSYVQKVSMSQGTMHRVLVGPKILKKDALVEQQQIEKRYKLKTILRESRP